MKPYLTPIARICKWIPCSQPFTIVPVRTRDTLREFCSTSCRAKHARSNQDTGTLAEHFWAKVSVCHHGKTCRDCCWLWQASKGGSGYGTLRAPEQKRLVGAHVVSWFLHTGAWPTDGMEIMHHCPTGDTKACVNPAHLHEGTHLENMREMYANGGPTQTWRKISEAQEQELCALYATGVWTYKQLAEKYGLSDGAPYDVIKRNGLPLNLPGTHQRRVHAARGERSANCKITDAQWQEALALYATGEWSSRRLAQRYGVDKSSILRRLKHQL